MLLLPLTTLGTLRYERPALLLYSVFDRTINAKPQSIFFAPDDQVLSRNSPANPHFLQHKMHVGTALVVSGGLMTALGIIITSAIVNEHSYTLAGDNLNAGFTGLSIVLILGGIALMYSGIFIRHKYGTRRTLQGHT